MEYKGKIECEEYSGFYHVPTLEHLIVNQDGAVVNYRTEEPCNVYFVAGYAAISSNGNKFIHRLLALTFLPEPHLPTEELDVNHIDGNKLNNAIDNLEWATRSENCLHAYKTGLRADNVPVLVKDLRDQSVIRHYSLQECARAFQTDAAVVFHHLKPANRGKVSWNFYVLIREGDEWPTIDESQIGKHRNGTAKDITATRVEDGFMIIFESTGAAAEHFGYKSSTLLMHMRRYKEKPYNGWVFKYLDDPSLAKENKIVGLKRRWARTPRKPVPIRVTDMRNGEVKEWASCEEFGKSVGISKNSLQKTVWRTKGFLERLQSRVS